MATPNEYLWITNILGNMLIAEWRDSGELWREWLRPDGSRFATKIWEG